MKAPHFVPFRFVAGWQLVRIILKGVLSGLAGFLFLVMVNRMIALLLAGQYKQFDVTQVLIFAPLILVFILARKSFATDVVRFSQGVFWKIRNEILYILIRSDYAQLQSRKEQVQAALVYDVNVLTQASLNIIQFAISLVMLLACMGYMAIRSLPLSGITLGVAALGVAGYLLSTKQHNGHLRRARDLENDFIKYFGAIMGGFKEIQMDPAKGDDIYNSRILPVAEAAYDSNTRAYTGLLHNQMSGQVLFYLLISFILIYYSVASGISVSVTVGFLFILLYLLSSIETIMVLLPSLLQARMSARRIAELKQQLVMSDNKVFPEQQPATTDTFSNIRITALTYCYHNKQLETTFRSGPINFQVTKGDVIFIYGGNGSGKTTFILLLLHLLKADTGTITFNGQLLKTENASQYKSLFAIVFNDFYLFDEFYGHRNMDREKAMHLITLFEIQEKVTITANGFSSIDLSTGQRKRLALIAVLLEDRPVVILDEWAADQDPGFRKKFYREIIPYLKGEGITVIAITHDDAYYHCADKLFKMEYGQLTDETMIFQEKRMVV
ncbi:cyclic peptide export ABC transporter [Chitinophaga nivalis]|uniref:Cyclic peptide export ABC transporter n=1 Tax=Chitinophaga nivalis TaxID=2991709 RepID=A0ABT3IKU6_9BACT|nr:cyclic peptide export ABC transporter [Chitinophaga nivalis]MCW3465920.1 cyclic peptide export ABC transporter [Chitinophaga nivalis]MCW3484389.1 cyclic peptide export ABC transporter [Chitinophaga nivalis]